MAEIEIMTLEEGLVQHLTEGMTLRIDLIAIPTCKEAIEAVNSGNQDKIIQLPKGWEWFYFGSAESHNCTEAYNVIHLLKLYKFINPQNLKGEK